MTRAMTTTAMPQPATRGSYPATTTNSAATSASSSTVVLSRTTSRPRCDVPYMGLAGVGSGGSHGDGRAGPTISFSGQPTLVTPATPTPSPEPSASPPRWTAELEERLRWAQRQLEEHQKRWSEGQDEYFEEVERLLELKRQAKKFMRRRSKDHQREGRSLERALQVAGGGGKQPDNDGMDIDGTDDAQDMADTKNENRLARILRRTSAGARHGALPSSGTASPRDDRAPVSISTHAPRPVKQGPSPALSSPIEAVAKKPSNKIARRVLRLARRVPPAPVASSSSSSSSPLPPSASSTPTLAVRPRAHHASAP